MPQKPFLSITIPTYNRRSFLENLLNHLAPQAHALQGMVQICICNDGSTDDTRQVVNGFQNRYPDLIRYQENEKNLGVALSMLNVMEMSQGEFIWLFGDDDMIIADGLKKMVDFIQRHCSSDTGLIALGHKSYFFDLKTQKEVVYFSSIEKEKDKIYPIARENVIGLNFPNSAWMSILIYNSFFFKKITTEEKTIINEALKAPRGQRDYIYLFILQLMFLKYHKLQAIRLNEPVVEEELHYYKFYVEDRFSMHYSAKKKMDRLLRFGRYAKEYQAVASNPDQALAKGIVVEMVMLKSFGAFNYVSFWKCLKMFFTEAPLVNALIFSFFFIALIMVPSWFLRYLFKQFIKFKHKDRWEQVWRDMEIIYGVMSQGTRRMVS